MSDDIAVLAKATGEQMLERLALVALQPTRIFDAGNSADLLKPVYPRAEILASDSHIKDNSIDLLFANLVLPWCDNIKNVLREWQRILRPEGVLMFASFGPDTLCEIEESPLLLPKQLDMHVLGDMLIQAGFADPVLDVEHFTLVYRDYKQLLYELQITKMIPEQQNTLAIKKTVDNMFALTYEVVYGHAFGTEIYAGFLADETGTVKIPLADLRKKN